MFGYDVPLINEQFYAEQVTPAQADHLLANGWRHFGTHFFRYNLAYYESDIRLVLPLRIRLADFRPSKSQRRVLRKNADLRTVVRAVDITSEVERMFDRHKRRFKHGVPNSIYDFLSDNPTASPCGTKELAIYDHDRLVAISYFEEGVKSTSGIYAMFEPDDAGRRLGILTMLKEIELSISTGRQFYYQGYAYEGRSFYDYKKRFGATERFDWKGNWEPLRNDEAA